MQLDWSKIPEIIFYIFISLTIIQILFYTLVFSRLSFHKNKVQKINNEGVSVIICARNEAHNLEKYLPSILEQKYPDFEVIVVNDASDDETESVLKRFKNKYQNLYVTKIDRDYSYRQGKKLALTVGIKASKNDILLFTDADCIVNSENWIDNFQQNFTENTEIVLGYGGYLKQRGLLNKIIRYDTLFIAIQYLSYAKIGMPYMGVGRNLAYRKSLFFKNRGFASHLNVISGDDDLFVNQNANNKNTKIIINPEAFTHSNPKTGYREWFRQKSRHFSTSKYYKFKHKFMLWVENLSRIFFYLTFILLISNNDFYIFAVSLFIVRLIIYILVIKNASKKLNEQGLIILGIFFDLIFPIINFLIYFTRIFSGSKDKWK